MPAFCAHAQLSLKHAASGGGCATRQQTHAHSAHARASERRLEVLLSLLLGVDGVEDGLALGLVALEQLLDLGVHVGLEPRQALLQVLVAQVLQLSQRARRTVLDV